MAKVDIAIPGERLVESFTALVPQPTAPSTARAPDAGLVELSYVNPTVLVPGPPGPPGPAGSRWYTGVGDPTTPGTNFGDMYLNDTDGTIWTWNGTAWVDTGTDLSPDASELLIKIKTVDGSGSGLDADTLDGKDSLYFATDADMTAAENNLGNINAEQITQNNRLSAIETVNVNQDNAINGKAPINSPNFTGNPTAPTPAPGDDDQSLATTEFVQDTVNAAIGGIAPFPEAPVDGKTYGRKNADWSAVVGGAIVSDTAPASPQVGQMWFESDSGNTYIWYDDGNTQQWVMQNVMPTGPTGTGTAAISDGPPTNPVNGTLWYESDTGTLFVYYDDGNTRQWVQAGGITGPAPPMDGNEYVMVNGVWRLSRQSYDIAGKSAQDIPVPAWGPAKAKLYGTVQHPSNLYNQMRLSVDGTTFFAGATDYLQGGSQLVSSSGTVATGVYTGFPAAILTGAADHLTWPSMFEVTINLTRSGSALFAFFGQGKVSSAAGVLNTHFFHGQLAVGATASLSLGAIRWQNSGSAAVPTGKLTVEWLP